MKTASLLFLMIVVLLSACKNDIDIDPICNLEAGPSMRFFEFEHVASGKTFIAWTNQDGLLAVVDQQLSLPLEQRTMHINGPIIRLSAGCGDLNRGWRWVHKPNAWTLADVSIELCDGNPQYVEDHLDEYVDVVGAYCPWSSRLKAEISSPF
ncbi:MAG TPA: hypothetical protein PKE06_07090 [Flavilitoribacter sp.]|nr:hypothetical protein [Flavilitoribacter sp.]HMQ88093.1 hypothetical protein [Flavilitoribacter sp.]